MPLERLFTRASVLILSLSIAAALVGCGTPSTPEGGGKKVNDDQNTGIVNLPNAGLPKEATEGPEGTPNANYGDPATPSEECRKYDQICTPSALSQNGFVCVDDGTGTHRCRVVCGKKLAGGCGDGFGCVPWENKLLDPLVEQPYEGYCEASECTGVYDKTSCGDGKKCTPDPDSDGRFVCVENGAKTFDEKCNSSAECGEGLHCQETITSPENTKVCTQLCSSTEQCTVDGTGCVGVGTTGYMSQQSGTCDKNYCDPRKGSDCKREGKTGYCFAVSEVSGVCLEKKTDGQGEYGICGDANGKEINGGCNSGLQCITGIREDGQGVCLKNCSTISDNQVTRDASCKGGSDDVIYECLALRNQRFPIQGGVCARVCGTDDIGKTTDKCSEGLQDYWCNVGGRGVACYAKPEELTGNTPSTPATAGNKCSDDVPCAAGLYCDISVCRSYCQPKKSTSGSLACQSGEFCDQGNFSSNSGLGYCREACDANASPSGCNHDNLKSCLFTAASGQHYCTPSGDVAKGSSCEKYKVVNERVVEMDDTCLPGLVCASEIDTSEPPLLDNKLDLSSSKVQNATCQQPCDPFSRDDQGCGTGKSCFVSSFNLMFGRPTSNVGYCVEHGENPSESKRGDTCTDPYKPCSDGTICIGVSEGVSKCLDLCNLHGDATEQCGTKNGRGVKCVYPFRGNPSPVTTFGVCADF